MPRIQHLIRLTAPLAATAALFALAVLTSVAAPLAAATWTVNCDPATGPDALTINGGVVLAADGDTVVVESCPLFPFTYTENVQIASRTELHIVAADAGFFGVATEGVAAPLFGAWPVVIDASGIGDCVTISSSADILVAGFAMTTCGGNGITVDDSERVTLENNRIDRPAQIGIVDTEGVHQRIVGNIVSRTGNEGVVLEACVECLLNDNRVLRLGASGIVLAGSDRSVVTNNEVLQASVDGIFIASGQAQRVARNTIVNNVGNDILIDVLAVDTDIVGNDVTAAPVDLGVGTDAAANL